jgi:hypothetical protein
MRNRLRIYRSTPSSFYVTDSLQVAAYLNLALGPRLVDVQAEGRKVYFVFENPAVCRLLAREYAERSYVSGHASFATYWDDVGAVPAHRFARSLKLMREEMAAVLAGEQSIAEVVHDYCKIEEAGHVA